MKLTELFASKAKSGVKSIIISAVLTLIIGIMLTFNPSGSISLMTKIISLGLMVVGIYELIIFFKETKEERLGNASFALGVIIFAIGLYMYINDQALTNIIFKIIGIMVCVKSIYKIQLALSVKDYSGGWKYALVSGIIVLSIGIVMIFYTGDFANTVAMVIGICLIISSIYEIVESLTLIKKINTTTKAIDAVFVEKNKE
jgi:uncharacterized membrane protein HdeD (DUF308 family)